jgi:hypothetical protein
MRSASVDGRHEEPVGREKPRLIGDEMLVWSDLDGAHGPGPVRGTALLPFLAAARGRVLVVGPHDPALFDALGEVTVLVRGVPDAERLAGRQGLTVLCGSPAKLTAEGTFDTVIALAGVERLDTAESDGTTWAELLSMLQCVLDPDGVLILGVENPLGLHRLVRVPRPLTDTDWTPLPDDTRPATLAGLRAAAGAATRVYNVYPDPVAPELILPEGAEGGATEAALTRAFKNVKNVLQDPATVAVDSVRHGVGPAFAPGWIIVAARDEQLLPEVLREPDPAASGPTLQSLIAHAAARRDLPAVRNLVTTWQNGPAAGVPAGQLVAGPDGTLVAAGPADTSDTGIDGTPGSGSGGDRVAAADPGEALRDLASHLLRPGFPHPWPGMTGTAGLARILAAMAGRQVQIGDQDDSRELPFAELVADRERLVRELEDARAQAAFFEAELSARETDLRTARRMVELLSGTGPARAGQAFVGGVRAARRVLRRRG